VIGALLLLIAARWLAQRSVGDHSTPAPNPVRFLRATLAALAAIAILAYFNFGSFHYPEFAHEHDIFHYFMGAKYFPELGYTKLYDCGAAAEAEAGFADRVLLRAQRDLQTNALIDGATVLARSADCHRLFSRALWQKFVNDVRFFANARDLDNWNRILRDHGFNASPVWIALARPIVRDIPATSSVIGRTTLPIAMLGSFDPLLLLASLGALIWAFDLTTTSVVAVVFCCNPLGDFSWVGGGFLRQLWLAALVLAVTFLRRKHWSLGGLAIAFAALLQLFPTFCVLTIACTAALERWRTGNWPTEGLQILASAGAMAFLLVVITPFAVQRTAAWSEFAANTTKHEQTPSVNQVGLKTAFSFQNGNQSNCPF
jgi:hypothetical protein